GLHVERKNSLAGLDPVADGSRPHHRVAAGEDYVTGKDDAVGWEVDQRVATRVRRADLDQPHLAAADLQHMLALEGAGRQRQGNVTELKGAEDATDIRAHGAQP